MIPPAASYVGMAEAIAPNGEICIACVPARVPVAERLGSEQLQNSWRYVFCEEFLNALRTFLSRRRAIEVPPVLFIFPFLGDTRIDLSLNNLWVQNWHGISFGIRSNQTPTFVLSTWPLAQCDAQRLIGR